MDIFKCKSLFGFSLHELINSLIFQIIRIKFSNLSNYKDYNSINKNKDLKKKNITPKYSHNKCNILFSPSRNNHRCLNISINDLKTFNIYSKNESDLKIKLKIKSPSKYLSLNSIEIF